MKASVGDRIVIHGRTVAVPDRDGEITEVHGADGAPPYLVRWENDGRLGLCFPGSDAQVEHHDSAAAGKTPHHRPEPRLDLTTVARWARTHGHLISDNHIPRSVLDAYLRSH